MSTTRHLLTHAIFAAIFIIPFIFCHRGGNKGHESSSASILDIINTKRVEKLLAERRDNASKEEKRFLEMNDLDDNYTPPTFEEDVYQHHIMVDPPIPLNPLKRTRIGINMLMRQNNGSASLQGTELLSDLTGFAGNTVLKSSKNALLVTKKEYLKKDWCKTEPLVQKIREDGCLTRTVINRFCYGQCNSFYIPKSPKRRRTKERRYVADDIVETEDDDLNGAAFKSCAFCKPKKFTWITITLRCPSMIPQLKKKRIQRIKQCKCIAENFN